MEVNIKDLFKLENMNIFAQYSGICWLVSSLAILFFDDNNKLSTLKLFDWTERDSKIIPVISKYKNTGNKDRDLLMYFILEIIRVNIKRLTSQLMDLTLQLQ